MIKFYDTNALLHIYNTKSTQPFIISNLTLKELENIKNNINKTEDIKYKARHLITWLAENSELFHVIKYKTDWDKEIKKNPILTDNTDSRIIISALKMKEDFKDLIFMTFDLNCFYIAKELGLKASYKIIKDDSYTGYKEIILNQNSLNEFYSSFSNKNSNLYNLLTNEYLIIKNSAQKIIDIQKFLGIGKGYSSVNEIPFNSNMFGKIKAKDAYQKIVMDSMFHNKFTVVRGPAGTGKSLLSLGYLFDRLEKGKIDKIIIFCNTVATQGSAKLGYYPGSKNQKLLDSQIGNFLASKLGDKMAVEMLIDKNQLVLLPMADIRGFDTSGMKAGIYITEAQNMSIDLMKLALQRVGEDSVVILDGDSQAQVDLGVYAGNNNGLRRVSAVFRGKDFYGETTLLNIYRSQIAKVAEQM